MYVTQHTLKVTHFTRTLDLKMKKESALQHRNNSKTCTLGKKEIRCIVQCKKALEAFEKMATSTTVRREKVNCYS